MSAFRPLRPSSQTTSDSPTSPSTDTRPPTASGSAGEGGPSRGKKRRAPSHVTANACTNCKKARAKCDGEEPARCSRCIGRDIADQCHYDVHVKTAKEEMVRKIKSLEQQNQELQGNIKDIDLWVESIFHALKNDDKGGEVLQRLKQGHSYQQLTDWLGRSPIKDIRQLSPSSEDRLAHVVRKYERTLDSKNVPDGAKGSRWTQVTSDDTIIHHLMALYFAWVHPVHMLFSEKHFMMSFRTGDHTYCSPALVNIMCAMGSCLLIDQGGSELDARLLSRQFLEQVRPSVTLNHAPPVTMASTYAIMFLVEVSGRQARVATSHLRLAVEIISRPDIEVGPDTEALEVTRWGIQSLSNAWAGFIYQKPAAPIRPPAEIFSNVETDKPDAIWRAYREPQDNSRPGRPSHAIMTAKALAGLDQIIYEIIDIYFGSQGSVTAKSILHVYKKLLTWHDALPQELRISDEGDPPLPHVFALHIHYHTGLCHLLQPLLAHSHFNKPTREHFRSIVERNARLGLGLLHRYGGLYTNRYQPPLQAFCLVHLADTFVRHTASDFERQEVVHFCLEMLKECRAGFLMAGTLQAMFCQCALECGVVLPKDVESLMGGRTQYGPEDLLDTCERISYNQPIHMILSIFEESIAQDFEHEWRRFIEEHGKLQEKAPDPSSDMSGLNSRDMQITSILDT